MVVSGGISLILGVMIYRQFPVSATWLVGVLVGIRLVFTGWTMIAMGAVLGVVPGFVAACHMMRIFVLSVLLPLMLARSGPR